MFIYQTTRNHTQCLPWGEGAGAEREVGMENATRSAGTSRAYGDEMKLVNLLKVR